MRRFLCAALAVVLSSIPARADDPFRLIAPEADLAIKVEQPDGPEKFEVPNWDQVSQKKVREALLTLASTLPDTKRMFGPKDEVDPVRRLIGSASGWGENPEKDALYLNVTPAKNDGKTVYKLTNRSKQERLVVIEHHASNWKLDKDGEKPVESTRQTHRFEWKVAAGKVESKTVTEAREESRSMALANASDPDGNPILVDQHR